MPKREATQRSSDARTGPLGRIAAFAWRAVRRVARRTAVLARRYGLAVAFVLAGVLGGLGYSLFTPATYTATAFVLVVDQGENGGAGPAAVSFAQAYGRLAPLPETLRHSSIALPRIAPGATREHIQASTSPDTPLVRLTGSGRSGADAAAFANAAADALVRYGTSHRTDTGVRVALMSLAAAPATPTSPNLPLDLAVGTASGVLLAGLSAAIVSGRRGRGSRDASRTRIAGAGTVPPPAAEPVEIGS
ncbi:Wzz/FepE/Etk N-terminal domain-containing protein [Actinomadura macra]|uniref:Wzz/FepE/Etk N-terminal domain-containing protein n=1 Tax=Actinomadura macra TaxID=46164 RepID=UPI0008323222|nr:Wzz/FepE/Etk N-terminal domain-containing protein [Actinomadura macra]